MATHAMPHSRLLDLHQCAFGSKWRKATPVIFGGVTEVGDFALAYPGRLGCLGRRGFCSFRPGRQRSVFEAKAMTSVSASRPPQLAVWLCKALLNLS
eukprot:5543672-Pyramimonas_sp.AAC.1